MESNYNSDNFERLLRESSDQYRMYPSESVWKSVYSALHTRRKWFGFGLLLLMLSAGFVTTIMITNSETAINKQAATQIKVSTPVVPAEPQSASQNDNSLPTLDNNSFSTAPKQNFLEPVNDDSRIIDNSILITSSFGALSSLETLTTPIRIEETIVKEEQPGGNTIQTVTDEQLTAAPLTITISDEATDQNLFFTSNRSETKKATAPGISLTGVNNYPYSIESVINSYVRRSKKLSFQFYFTPTISYRKLSENKSYLRSAVYNPNNTALYYDVNKVVTHKPDMGVEVGVAAKYAISKKMKLRAGLQFNTSRYDIKAFRSATEVTTIALNTGNFTADSVNTLSNYRNFNGYKSDWLHNLYFQIAAPIGVELQLAGDNRIKFGIASTVQPTYILGDKVYMISTNYKNYAEVPSLIRRWNVNASFEAFVGYSTGRMNWQVGPQVRYQLMSSFVKEYPVKENLFDFGLKIGVSANR